MCCTLCDLRGGLTMFVLSAGLLDDDDDDPFLTSFICLVKFGAIFMKN